MEVGGWVQISLGIFFCGKSSQNSYKPVGWNISKFILDFLNFFNFAKPLNNYLGIALKLTFLTWVIVHSTTSDSRLKFSRTWLPNPNTLARCWVPVLDDFLALEVYCIVSPGLFFLCLSSCLSIFLPQFLNEQIVISTTAILKKYSSI